MNYIDLKKLINQEIRLIKDKIKNQIEEKDIDNLVSKYQANNLHELIEILLCHTSRNCLNLNFKDFIQELNEELYNLSFENQLLKKELNNALSKNQIIENNRKDLLKTKNKEDIQELVDELVRTKNRMEADTKFIEYCNNLLKQHQSKDKKNYPIPTFKGIDIK